jgi:hypothetical protein
MDGTRINYYYCSGNGNVVASGNSRISLFEHHMKIASGQY